MTENRNDYGFPHFSYEPATNAKDIFAVMQHAEKMFSVVLGMPPGQLLCQPKTTPLQRAQAIAAEVRARRGMVVKRITEEQ